MKAKITPKRLSHAEAVSVTQKALEVVSPAVVAAVLFVLYRRGWHKDKILSLYKDIVALFKYPQAFDRWLDDIEIKATLTERCGINWDELIEAVKVEDKRG